MRDFRAWQVLTSGYVIGMIAAVTFGGFAVDQATAESYESTMEHADHVTRDELMKIRVLLH